MKTTDSIKSKARRHPILISLAMRSTESSEDGLVFRPEPPGDQGRLKLPVVKIRIELEDSEMETILKGLEGGALSQVDVLAVLEETKSEYGVLCPDDLERKLLEACNPADESSQFGDIDISHHLEHMSLVAVKILDRTQKALLNVDPLCEIRFIFSDKAKITLRLSWEAMAKHGRFPLPPKGSNRLNKLREKPSGMMHFVSASDEDAGYFYTMGIALSPEAQALGEMDISYGLDGELIVPGQAVAPIPPTLAMSTRLFAASIPTSSNISEDIQSIPYSSFAHPEILDITPLRGYLFRPKPDSVEDFVKHAKDEMREQLKRYKEFIASVTPQNREFLPDVGAAIDVSGLENKELVSCARSVLEDFDKSEQMVTALFLLLNPAEDDALATTTEFKMTPRVEKTCQIIDAAKELGLKYVAICDQDEDEWMPNLHEYFTSSELTYLADYSDKQGVIVCDGRPVDPVYTASTAAQRIQSVYTTLSVDILKMGMWLCLDALAARRVWRELQKNPHIPERMFLMPIGIIEPYSAFVDNRNRKKTPRPILDPFEKIKFMIEEAENLGMPSLLTDTRHKSRWVLLGSVDNDMPPHIREPIGAIPLIGHKKFMKCEKLARKANILLGQAGSIEADQIFRIMSETISDAAHDRKNPASAIWTAETERVLRKADGSTLRGDLQSQRRAAIMPYLSVTNRAMESHAKINGWLEYLDSKGKGDEKLRGFLLNKRESLASLQNEYLDAQAKVDQSSDADFPEALKDYRNKWEAYRTAFCDYHAKIKEHFKEVRDKVAEVWSAT
ncbi:MAG: hypothetical protein JSV96_05915 [Candidatus Aminicenantes bacterium]|nr:MAG: hypothetical protein JSV96_05915 [Candidatus Aminicenantes bacterium]